MSPKAPRGQLRATTWNRKVSTIERELFGLDPKTDSVNVQDIWLEVDLEPPGRRWKLPQWRAAFRLVPIEGAPVIAEVRVFPADRWTGRQPGEWRGHVLGVRARSIEAKDSGGPPPSGSRFPPLGAGIAAQMMRQVPFAEVRRFSRAFAEMLGGMPNADIDSRAALEMRMAGFSGRPASPKTKRRSTAWPDERYAQLAHSYVARVDAGSRRPVADVAARHKLTPAQVRDAIHTARTRGLLSPTTKQGRPLGTLTPAALVLLGGRGKRLNAKPSAGRKRRK